MSTFLNENIHLIESDRDYKVIKYESEEHKSVVLTNKGHVYIWKSSFISQNKPELLHFSVNNYIIDVCCGKMHTFLLTKYGEVFAFGQNFFGILGCGSNSLYVMEPTKVIFPDDQKIKFISCGEEHALALSHNENVYSWGSNNYGQLGINSIIDQYIPVLIELRERKVLISIRKIACGLKHSLLLSDDGDVYSFGGDIRYRAAKDILVCGKPRKVWLQIFPLKVKIEFKIVDISANFNKSIALSENGKFYIWGECGGSLYDKPTEIEGFSFAHIYEQFATNTEIISYLGIENEKIKNIEIIFNVKINKCIAAGNNFLFLANNGRVFEWKPLEEKIISRPQECNKNLQSIVEIITKIFMKKLGFLPDELIFQEPIVDICDFSILDRV